MDGQPTGSTQTLNKSRSKVPGRSSKAHSQRTRGTGVCATRIAREDERSSVSGGGNGPGRNRSIGLRWPCDGKHQMPKGKSFCLAFYIMETRPVRRANGRPSFPIKNRWQFLKNTGIPFRSRRWNGPKTARVSEPHCILCQVLPPMRTFQINGGR